MKLARVILRVTDLDRSVSFWSGKVGFAVLSESPGFAFLNGRGVELVLNELGSDVVDESLTELVLESDEVLVDHAAMVDRGVPFEVDLRAVTESEGMQLLAAHFKDPDGHLASLTGWVDPD